MLDFEAALPQQRASSLGQRIAPSTESTWDGRDPRDTSVFLLRDNEMDLPASTLGGSFLAPEHPEGAPVPQADPLIPTPRSAVHSGPLPVTPADSAWAPARSAPATPADQPPATPDLAELSARSIFDPIDPAEAWKPQETAKPEKAEPEKAEPEKAAKPPRKVEKTGETERVGATGTVGNPETAEKPARTELVRKTELVDRTRTPEKPEKAEAKTQLVSPATGRTEVVISEFVDGGSVGAGKVEATTQLIRTASGMTEIRLPRKQRSTRLSLPRMPKVASGGRPGVLTLALVILAVVGLVVGGTALVRTNLFKDDASTNPPLAAPPPPAAPPAPAPDAAAKAAEEARQKAKKQAEAAKKPAPAPGSAQPTLANCTKKVSDGAALNAALASASPGQKICAVGNMGGTRLSVKKGGTAAAPIQVVGDNTTVKGITVDTNNVVLAGFNSVGGEAPGAELTGNNITFRNNKVSKPTGGDYDGMRFFGNNLKILNNTISDINPGGSGAHADCMQTFTSGRPSSLNVTIDGNRCERVDNMCLMAEGPGDVGDGGGGDGTSANWTFSNNYCDTHAGQALMIEAVQNVTVKGNNIVGKVDKAFAFDIGSTGAKVLGNKLAAGIGYEVGMDSSSKKGYQGPAVGGAP
ncbi:hypothetical protein GCM10023321_33600 [Pseudonocardia eucalypti]|uniref:Right handed beta helix domain-containing protein n=1 Tax=Pseudonocardia eucalypti TaxID=648755 RepID=A0ABP9Q576_9PSEU|nr:hypothetical protein [Pseudonocardia eucalypti]